MFTTVIVQLLGTIVFAYVIGGVMNLVINFDPAARLTKQETQLLDGYMGHVKYSKIRKKRGGYPCFPFLEGISPWDHAHLKENNVSRSLDLLYDDWVPHW